MRANALAKRGGGLGFSKTAGEGRAANKEGFPFSQDAGPFQLDISHLDALCVKWRRQQQLIYSPPKSSKDAHKNAGFSGCGCCRRQVKTDLPHN